MNSNLPHDIDTEKQLLAALMFKNGEAVPKVDAIVSEDDFYRPEHQVIYRIILSLYERDIPPNLLSILEELRKTGNAGNVSFAYLKSIDASIFTNAYAVAHARIVKEKADLRRLIQIAQGLEEDAVRKFTEPAVLIAQAQKTLDEMNRAVTPTNKTSFVKFFAEHFDSDVDEMKAYANRSTGFANLDEYQFFSPGLYVIGATPAAGKTTFCWQLLEQLAANGETCIYCSYEMSRLELFSKSVAREIFRRVPSTELTAADIRHGGWSIELENTVEDFSVLDIDLNVLELQNETIDELLRLLKPLCRDKKKAPVVCLDYLQIVPTDCETVKLGVDDAVRKLKKFQRDTNTTFIVISSFNRMNYAQVVSFESFKESGNIEYTADVVWALQLNVMNEIKGGELVSETRRTIDEAKKQQPRQTTNRPKLQALQGHSQPHAG